MASRSSILFFVILNLLFFTMVSSTHTSCPPPSGGGSHGHSPAKAIKCPKDTLKFKVCAKLLDDLTSIIVGSPAKSSCCSLINGLADLEAAVCLCTAIKANVLGVKLTASLSLSLLLNNCGKKVPSGFQCA